MERKSKNILLMIGRDSFEKDRHLMELLNDSLRGGDYEIVSYNPPPKNTSYILDPEKKLAKLSAWLRKPLKAISLLRYPSRWKYYLYLVWPERELTIPERCDELREYVKVLGGGENVIILSRSSGGRVASLVADELGIKKLICLGYPFRHPEKNVEPERYLHLANLKTPFLIIQGTRDLYGGIESKDGYVLSSSVSLVYVDTDHDFNVERSEWERVMSKVKSFLA